MSMPALAPESTVRLETPVFVGDIAISAVSPGHGFMPQLDGLRALAVIAVLIHHLRAEYALPGGLTIGLLGVQLFFVLSGFLITGLLLDGRDAADNRLAAAPHILRQFYIRRMLRIFPLYYGVLAAGWLAGDPEIIDALPALATFTYNLRVAAIGGWPDHYAHFWSLCVEEQFYLMWPWVVVFAPRKHLPLIAAALVGTAIAYRLLAIGAGFNSVALNVLTPSTFDALGLGSLLAILSRSESQRGHRTQLIHLALPIAIVGIALSTVSKLFADVLGATATALLFVWMVGRASTGFGGEAKSLLEWKPLLQIGKISYGIYVYHLLLPAVIRPTLAANGIEPEWKSWAACALYSGITIVVAALSWSLIEHPINRLKRHFSLNA